MEIRVLVIIVQCRYDQLDVLQDVIIYILFKGQLNRCVLDNRILNVTTTTLLTNMRAHSSLSWMAARWSAVLPCFPPWPMSMRSLNLHITCRTATRFSSTAKCRAACFLSFKALGSVPLFQQVQNTYYTRYFHRESVGWTTEVCVPIRLG